MREADYGDRLLTDAEQRQLISLLHHDAPPADAEVCTLGARLLAFLDAAEEATVGRVERCWRRWPGRREDA